MFSREWVLDSAKYQISTVKKTKLQQQKIAKIYIIVITIISYYSPGIKFKKNHLTPQCIISSLKYVKDFISFEDHTMFGKRVTLLYYPTLAKGSKLQKWHFL